MVEKSRTRLLAGFAAGFVTLLIGVFIAYCWAVGTHPDAREALWIILVGNLLAMGALAGAAWVLFRSGREHREFEEFLASIIENIPVMLFVKDARDLRFVRFNRAGEEFLGRKREDLLGKNDFDFFPKDQAEFFTSKDREVLASGRLLDIPEEPILTQDKGPRMLHTKKIPILGKDGTPQYLLGISEDITGHKRIERMKKEVITMTTHELKAPLSSIFGALDMLKAMPASEFSAEARKLVDLAHRNGERMLRLVEDFLWMEKLESGFMEFRLQPLELAPLLNESVELNRALGKRLETQFKIAGPLPAARVNVDKDRFSQVMANLLSNAAKYSPSHGTVEVSASAAAGRVRICVSDKGTGIPLDFQDRIFQKFAQAGSQDLRQKGTGLGLAVSKAIVEKLGGSIGFESRPGVGTTFFFDLPCV